MVLPVVVPEVLGLVPLGRLWALDPRREGGWTGGGPDLGHVVRPDLREPPAWAARASGSVNRSSGSAGRRRRATGSVGRGRGRASPGSASRRRPPGRVGVERGGPPAGEIVGHPVRSWSPRRTRSMIAMEGPDRTAAARVRRTRRSPPTSARRTPRWRRRRTGSGGQVARGAEQPARVGQLGIVRDAGEPEVDEDRGSDPPSARSTASRRGAGPPPSALEATPSASPGGEPDQGRPRAIGPSSWTWSCSEKTGYVAGGDVRHRRPGVGVDDLGHPGGS